MFKDYYKILGVSPSADALTIKQAYREMSMKWHPDRNLNDDVTTIMQDINEAYAILKDATKRSRYDKEYIRFCGTYKQKEKAQESVTKNERNYSHFDWTYNYDVQDENLKEDIKAARVYAKELVEEFLRNLKETSKKAASGAWEGMKGYIYAAIFFSIVGIFIRGCMNNYKEHYTSSYDDWYNKTTNIDAPIADINPNSDIEIFQVPKTWTKYYMANNAFSLSIPPVVELRHEYDNYVKKIHEMGLECNTDDVVFQQKGLAKNSAEAFSHYCRIMIQHISGKENDFPLTNETFPLDSEMRAELREIIDNELGIYELIGEPVYCWINIKDIKAIEMRYNRTGSNNYTTACRIYLVFNDKEMVKIIVSYREQESDIWLPDLVNVIKTFKWG